MQGPIFDQSRVFGQMIKVSRSSADRKVCPGCFPTKVLIARRALLSLVFNAPRLRASPSERREATTTAGSARRTEGYVGNNYVGGNKKRPLARALTRDPGKTGGKGSNRKSDRSG